MDRSLIAFLCLVIAFAAVHCETDPEEDFRKLPKLFDLDDYEQCMSRKDGIYCLGVFEIHNDGQPNPIYDIIQEKSKDEFLYNRTLLHRGVCLTTSCPSGEQNTTERFERCVDASVRSYSLRARLQTLYSCREYGKPRPLEQDTSDWSHQFFLYFVFGILAMNVVGTAYDVYFSKEGEKNPLLMSFSLRANWNHLVWQDQNSDPRLQALECLNSFRFISGMLVILCHVYILTTFVYQASPRFMEEYLYVFNGFMLGSSVAFTVVYLMISNFLITYNILIFSMKMKIQVSLLFYPVLFIKRVIRVYPVYLFLHWFAATWWQSFGDGPLHPLLVDRESEICRKKFWVSTLFLQNWIYRKESCLIQTWIIACDMQLHALTLFITLLLIQYRKHAIKVLLVLCAAATALLAYQAFTYKFVPSYFFAKPELFRTLFVAEDTFSEFYINPSSGLLCALVGVLVAFVHLDHQERDIKISRSKVLVFLHHIMLPFIFAWFVMGYVYFRHLDMWSQHLMVVIEKVVCALACSFTLYSFINHDGVSSRLASWRGFKSFTRLSFSVSVCHWFINIMVLNSRWGLHQSSRLGVAMDIVGVFTLAHIVALPLTLFLEFPIQKFIDRLINMELERRFVKKKQ